MKLQSLHERREVLPALSSWQWQIQHTSDWC